MQFIHSQEVRLCRSCKALTKSCAQAVIKLVTEAEALGVQFIYNQEVHGFPWEIEGDVAGVVYGTGREELFADCVVLCNGVGVQGLAAKAGYTLRMDHK